ncbi:MAG: tcyA [Frankiales bacterium]|jgi:cystine transport system substrate-binding protein|nr:tcyA [Frankiales bacterium]
MRTKLSLVVLAVLSAALLGGCGGSGGATASPAARPESLPSQIKAQGVLKVGTEGTYTPFSFHDPKTHELTGYDVDVARAVASRLGVKAQFFETPFDAIFAGLEAERYDMIANQISITPERLGKYDFSTPYTVSSGVVVTRSDVNSVKSLADIKGKTSAQSVTSNFAQIAKAAGAKLEPVEGFTQAITLVKQKRVDMTINDKLAVLYYLKTTGDKGVKIALEIGERTQQALVFRKGSGLAAEVDKILASLRADGTLTKISMTWFGADVTH